MQVKIFGLLILVCACSSAPEDVSVNYYENHEVFSKSSDSDILCQQGLISDCGNNCCYDNTRLPGHGIVLKSSLYNPAYTTYTTYDRWDDDPAQPVIVHLNTSLIKKLGSSCYIANPVLHGTPDYYIGIVCK